VGAVDAHQFSLVKARTILSAGDGVIGVSGITAWLGASFELAGCGRTYVVANLFSRLMFSAGPASEIVRLD
jgi:hypothetical protein